MSNAIFPFVPGVTWKIQRKPNWSTRIQRGYSGREIRTPYYANPIWDFEFSWNYLYGYITPGTLFGNVPDNPTLTLVSETLPAATYYIITTFVYNYGEGLPSNEVSQTTAAGQGLQVNLGPPDSTAIGWNVYIGLTSGGEIRQNGPVIPIGVPSWTMGTNDPSGSEYAGLLSYAAAMQQYIPTAPFYPFATSPPNADWSPFQTMEGFFNARNGAYDSFLIPDFWVGYQPFTLGTGVGDGTTTAFQMYLPESGYLPQTGFNELIQNPFGPVVPYINSTAQTSGFSVGALGSPSGGLVTFSSAPATGTQLTARAHFFQRVRFSDDNLEFEEFMYNLYSLKTLKFTSVKL